MIQGPEVRVGDWPLNCTSTMSNLRKLSFIGLFMNQELHLAVNKQRPEIAVT